MQWIHRDADPKHEPASWEEVYDELGESVFRFLHRLTRSSELAADLTHDTFVRVYEKWHLFDGSGPLGAWVFRIARNLTLDHLRRPHPFVQNEQAVNAPLPVERELHLSLRQALDELPESYRTVLLLYDVDGFTHDEIGRMLNIAVGTSKARLSRGRSMLRHALGHEA